MNFADGVIISIIAAIVIAVIIIMRKQKKSGNGCNSGCAGCSKANNCSIKK
jgi:preprotein translocase subunit SecG